MRKEIGNLNDAIKETYSSIDSILYCVVQFQFFASQYKINEEEIETLARLINENLNCDLSILYDNLKSILKQIKKKTKNTN